MRTAPIGPSKGMPEIISAADAALMATMSWGFSWSAPRMVPTTWVSLRYPSANDGRRGRSIRRQVRMAWSVGRPSRRKNEPGIFPAAYARSSMSTVRGKKSIPSRTPWDALAVTSTTVSPMRLTTAPWDWGASFPVSNDRVLSVPEMGPDTEMASAMCTPYRVAASQLSVVGHPGITPGIRRLAAGDAAPSYWIRLSAAQAEAGDQRPITLYVVVADVVEQPATTANEHQESPSTVVVLLVDLQVVGELVDPLREQRHLHFRRPGVGVVDFVLADRRGFVRHAERSLRSGRECAPTGPEHVAIVAAALLPSSGRYWPDGCPSFHPAQLGTA